MRQARVSGKRSNSEQHRVCRGGDVPRESPKYGLLTYVAAAGLLLALLGCVSSSPGCLLSPRNGQIADEAFAGEDLDFAGFLLVPEREVYPRAWHPGREVWEDLPGPAALSSSEPFAKFFDQDLYPWSTVSPVPREYWEPGAVGFRAKVGAQTEDKNWTITFDEGDDVLGCAAREGSLASFVENCTSAESPHAYIQTRNYVPVLTEGDSSCAYGSRGCARCVDNVEHRFAQIFEGSDNTRAWQIASSGLPARAHLQGMARFPDVLVGSWDDWVAGQHSPVVGRVVVTRSKTVPGLFVLEQRMLLEQDAEPEAWRDGTSAFSVAGADVQDSGLDHAGGVQALGTTVAVAIECSGCKKPAEIRFYELGDGFEPVEINRLVLDGEPNQVGSAAASVAVTRLGDGRYLMFVSGTGHGTNEGWFYVSDRPSIVPATKWNFLQTWHPPCTEKREGCWTGASGMTFLTDCSPLPGGNIYLVATHGSEDGYLPSHNYVHLFRLRQSSADGLLSFESVRLLQPATQLLSITPARKVSYRWAGQVNVSPQGLLSSDVAERDVNLRTGGFTIQQFVPPRPH
jgi:hypothetical protein